MPENDRPALQQKMETQTGVVLAGLLWLGALEWLIIQPTFGVWAAGVAAIMIVAAGGLWLGLNASRWLLIVHLFVVVATSATALSFVTDRIWQHGVAIIGAGLVMGAFRQAFEPGELILRGRLAAFSMTIVMWFGWLSILSINIFTNLATWWLMIFGAILMTAVTVVVWAEAEVPWRRFSRWLPLWALWGAEMALVIWWLPTSIIVSSIVATTIIMLFLQATRHYWLDTWSADRGRRYISVGSTIVAAVLLTARWA